jgi:hypothetical protein
MALYTERKTRQINKRQEIGLEQFTTLATGISK